MFGFKRRITERAANPKAHAVRPTSMAVNEIPLLAHDNFSRIIEEARVKARAYLADARRGNAFVGTPAEKVAAARDFVRNSNVGVAGLRIWDSTIHYHAWCKREDWSKWNDIGASEVLEQSDLLPHSTGFRWRGHTWLFILENNGPSCSGDKDIGKFRVTVDDELVLETAVAKGYNEFDSWYEVGEVYALTVGPWADTLIDMWADLELTQERRRTATKNARLEQQASRIKLD